MFVDQIKIFAKAGKGGDGACSFRREKFVPRGGPDGGDGGRGGSIVLRADPHIDTLAQFFYEPILRAKGGENGRGRQCYGKGGPDKLFKVPIGTVVYRMPPGVAPFAPKPKVWEMESEGEVQDAEFGMPDEEESEVGTANPPAAADLELVVDLDHEGAELVLCKGGDGGKGNIHFKSSRNRVPRQFTPGDDGEEGYFLLELRSIADAGLVGYPKVAPYPFTTLHPVIGIVDFGEFKRAPVADIPGLVEGAHRNVGLGHEFLKHIVRCRVLLFVIDMAGSEGRNPIDDFGQLRKELSLYDPTLADRPWLVAANKMDDPNAEANLRHFKRRFRKAEVLPISAELGEGIEDLKDALHRHLFPAPAASAAESDAV